MAIHSTPGALQAMLMSMEHNGCQGTVSENQGASISCPGEKGKLLSPNTVLRTDALEPDGQSLGDSVIHRNVDLINGLFWIFECEPLHGLVEVYRLVGRIVFILLFWHDTFMMAGTPFS